MALPSDLRAAQARVEELEQETERLRGLVRDAVSNARDSQAFADTLRARLARTTPRAAGDGAGGLKQVTADDDFADRIVRQMVRVQDNVGGERAAIVACAAVAISEIGYQLSELGTSLRCLVLPR